MSTVQHSPVTGVRRDDLERARIFTEGEISRCRELALKPGSDTDYWHERMDDRLDMWIMGRDQLRCIEALES